MASQTLNFAGALGTASAAVLTCPAGSQIAITDLLLLNITAAARTASLTLYRQASGIETALGAPNRSLAAGSDPYRHPGKIFLGPGDQVRAAADQANAVVLSAMYAVSSSVTPLAKGLAGKGTYSASATYAANDVVDDGTNSYVSLQDANTGHAPSTSGAWWMILARRGPAGADSAVPGPQGSQGPQGPTGPQGPPGTGNGDFVGPSASSDGEVVLFSGTTGKLAKRSNTVAGTFGLSLLAQGTQSAAQTALAVLPLTGGTLTGALTLAADPTAALQPATKQYVDQLAQGLDPKGSVKAASTANLTLSGEQTVDTVALVAGDRVLVKNQTTAAQNGLYVVAGGAWPRALDADVWIELVDAYLFVEQGTQADTAWVCQSDQGGTLGTTAVTFSQFGNTVIVDDAITNAKLANMAAGTLKGNNAGTTGDPVDLTVPQVKTLLAYAFSDLGGTLGLTQIGDGLITFAKLASAAVASAASDIWSNVANKVATVTALWAAQAPVAWTYAATYTPDMSTFLSATMTLTGNLTLANPTNPKAGQAGEIVLTQDATGSRTVSYGSYWKFIGGTPTASTAASAVDVISYRVVSATLIVASFGKGVA